MKVDGKLPVIGLRRLRIAVDGDGVRTLIGLAGCPLRCRYCLNPHAWNGETQPMYLSPEELYEKVKIDNLYFRTTGGGLTLGGGEPLLHMPAIARLAEICPDEWSMWAETSLQVDRETVIQAANVFDHFLVDLKTADPEIYRAYTGGTLDRVLENVKLLLDLVGPDRITLRIPQIPDFATEDDCKASEEIVRAMGITDIDRLIYRIQ